MIDSLFQDVQSALLSPNPNVKSLIQNFRKEQQKLDNEELARSHILLRVLLVLRAQQEGKEIGQSDLLVLLRQMGRYFGLIKVSQDLWQWIGSHSQEFGIHGKAQTDGYVGLSAQEWQSTFLEGSHQIDQLLPRRNPQPVLGDGTLADMTARSPRPFSSFQSEGQRRAIQAALFAPAGTTTLITLPTGGGKSLCVYLPAWINSAGGQKTGGTTLVIVPTVALAIDQTESARRYFENEDEHYLPHYVAGNISKNERQIIRRGLSQGSIPILFLSPESLLGSEFYSIVQEVTRKGFVKRIVIDEAHLIDSWGTFFRTDFQLLSGYFHMLYEVSQKQLRLILLSATISRASLRTLKQLFTLDGGFNHVQVNQLRPEINYWVHYASNQYQKEAALLEAIRYLPRPAIVYFTAPADAERWYLRLQNSSFKRIATFTGETDSALRLERVKAWRNNQIDLMLATSAFGLGVDKGDVRAVIHASVPETVDRLYQEIGRGGRDGFSTISLMIVTEADRDYAKNAASSPITPELAWERWQSMFETARQVKQNLRGEKKTLWIVNSQAVREVTMRVSDRNRDWNEHVLLIMQRAELIRIVELESSEEKPEIDYDEIIIEILHDALNTKTSFLELFSPRRNQELSTLGRASNELIKMLDSQSKATGRCIAYDFEAVYEPVALACGGCPACRRDKIPAYVKEANLEQIQSDFFNQTSLEPNKALLDYVGSGRVLQLLWDSRSGEVLPTQYGKLIAAFLDLDICQVLLPDGTLSAKNLELLEILKKFPYKPQLMMEWDEWHERQAYPQTLAIFLPNQGRQADSLHRQIMGWQSNTNAFLIYIVQRSLTLPSLNGRFIDRVNGQMRTIDNFLDWHKSRKYKL